MRWLGLDGRKALVLGAGGLGAACAAGLAEAGARLVVVDVDAARLKHLQSDSRLASAHTLAVDLSSSGACDEAVGSAAATLGGLDVLVHAVGTNDRRPVVDTPDDVWERIVTLNLATAFWAGRAAGRVM